MTFIAVRESEPPPLPEAVVAHWGRLGMPDVERFRRLVYRRAGKLWAAMATAERRCDAGTGVTPQALAELWAWTSMQAIVLGRPEDTTCETYAHRVAEMLAWVRETGRDLGAMTRLDLEAWVKDLALNRGNSLLTRKAKLAAVRGFFAWRATNGLGDDPSKFVPMPKVNPKLPRKFSEEQLAAMFRGLEQRELPEVRTRDKAMLLLLLSAGLRREEVANLNLHDLDLRANTGTVRINGKGAKQRDVRFEGPVVAALREWLGVRDNLGYVVEPDAVFVALWSAYCGRRIAVRGVENIVKFYVAAAGIKGRSAARVGAHRFRVTFATALYDEGAGPAEIQVLLGHSRIETTMGYIACSERVRSTRLSAAHQHRALGRPGGGRPRWMSAALGEDRG